MLFLSLSLLLLLLQLAIQISSSYCDGLIVDPCIIQQPRDFIFLLDASQSISKQDFYGPMIDYVQAIFCAFDPQLNNQVGLILFASEIKTYISFEPWTRDEWFNQTERLRADPTACCSCCTPHAEAFDLAYDTFLAKGRNEIKIAFVITAGGLWFCFFKSFSLLN